MIQNRQLKILSVVTVVITAAFGIITNLASNQIPKILEPYLIWVWPLFFILLVVIIILNVILEKTNMNLITLETLKEKMQSRCSLSDVKDLCYYMGIDYENYPDTKDQFIRELLKNLEQKGQIEDLISMIRSKKPWVLR